MQRDRILSLARSYGVDIAWVAFVGLNLIAMRLVPAWQTVPFLIIWVSLTAIYGARLWRLGSTLLTVAVVTLATGGLIGWQVIRGEQDLDYLADVPLLAMMGVIMVWHARTSPSTTCSCSTSSVSSCKTSRTSWERRSPLPLATPSSSSTPPPTGRLPRTPGWPLTSC